MIMENLNFVPLVAAMLFGAMYVMSFLALDRCSRLSGSESRKKSGTILAVFVFLLLLALGIGLPEYMWCIVPTAVVLLSFSLRITLKRE